MTPTSGMVIGGRYRIDRVLGEGGMGKLFVATDLRLERQVAVKFLHEQLAALDPKFAERFRQEALAACRVRHPAVVEIYDADVHEGSPWLAMELLHGQTLGAFLEQRALAIDETVWVGLEMLEGLAAVHDAGFVHRDLKPDNLFLQALGRGRVQLKLLDFGIVKRVTGNEKTTLTATGATIGTPWYVSPEQAAGARDLDHRSDLYTVAVILFECLTRRRPYEVDSFGALITQFYTVPPRRLTEVMPGAPPQLAELLAACLSVDRNVRPPSAHVLIDHLAALGIAPRPLTIAVQPAPSTPCITTSQAGAALPALGTPAPGAPRVSGTVAMTELAAHPIARAAGPASTAGGQRPSRVLVVLGAVVVLLVGLAAIGGVTLALLRSRSDSSHPASPPPVAVGLPPPPPSAAGASAVASAARAAPSPARSLTEMGLAPSPTAGPPSVIVGPARQVGGTGRFSSTVLDWSLAERSDALLDCYRDALRARADLSGQVELSIELAATGRVSNASTGPGALPPALTECVAGVVRASRFSPGPEGGSVSYAVPMYLGFGRPAAGSGRIGGP